MSFSEWKDVKLGNVVEISSSKRIYAKEYNESGVPFYRSKEIIEKNKGEEVSTELFISRQRFEEIKYKFGAPSFGDILLTSVGTLGVPYMVKNEEFYFKDGNLTWLKGFSENINNIFVYYWLISDYGKQQINAKCIGSTQKALTIDTLKKFDIKIPPIEEQKVIANILSNLDEKIKVNNRINKTLENMAQAIFKQWFMDFEFPNDDGEPYRSSGGEMIESELGMIPKGWEVKRVNDVTRIVRGASPRPIQHFMVDEGIPWVKISDATSSNSRFLANTKEFIKEEGRSKSREVTIGTLILSNSATPGIPKIMKINACVHDGWLIFDEFKQVNREFMYHFLNHERDGILQLSNGSVFRNLKTDILKNYKIVVPSLSVLEKADNVFRSISLLVDNVEGQNSQLIKIRDSLLTKLMSGEISVPLASEGETSLGSEHLV